MLEGREPQPVGSLPREQMAVDRAWAEPVALEPRRVPRTALKTPASLMSLPAPRQRADALQAVEPEAREERLRRRAAA